MSASTTNPTCDDAAVCSHCFAPMRASRWFKPVRRGERVFCCHGCAIASLIVGGRSRSGSAGEGDLASWLMAQFIFGVFLAMNVMMLSILLYWPQASGLSDRAVGILRWGLLGLSVPAMAVLAWPFATNTAAQFRQGRIGADALIAAGALSAFGYSAWSVVRGRGPIFFETATMLLVLVTLGKFLEASVRARASERIERLAVAVQPMARRVRKGGPAAFDMVAAEALAAGDVVIVPVGETVPADGIVRSGWTELDESMLTGEPMLTPAGAGRAVLAGAINRVAPIDVEVTAAGSATVAAHIRRLAESARRTRPQFGRLADRIAAVFGPGVVGAALATAGFWWWRDGPIAGLMNGLAVLVVACPCSLGIAVPLAGSAALGAAIGRGILVRSVELIERVGRIRTACFDKTGTLTTGQAELIRVRIRPGGTLDDATAVALAAAIESHSEHPLARAFIAKSSGERKLADMFRPDTSSIRVIPGGGISARCDLGEVLLGSRAMLADFGVNAGDWAASGPDEVGVEVLLAINGEAEAAFALADPPRLRAAQAVAALHQLGVRTALLSGDRQANCSRLAEAVGIADVRGELRPGGKLAELAHIRDRGGGPVAMIGDGINDAAALGGADVAVAANSAADLLRLNADVCLLRDDIGLVGELVVLGRRTRRAMKQNLAWAFAYNVLALPIAMSGLLHPLIAAAVMAVSGLIVTANSLRLARGAELPGKSAEQQAA